MGDGTSSGQTVGVDDEGEGQIVEDHAYTSHGTYTVTVIDSDGDEAAASTCVATITDSPTLVFPDDYTAMEDLGITAIPGETIQGQVYSFQADEADAVASDFTAEINWGDGSSSPGTITPANGYFSVMGTHVYADGSATQGSVTITGVGSHPDEFSGPIDIHLVYPTISNATTNYVTAVERQEFQATFATFSAFPIPQDPGDLAATIDYGDGIVSPATIVPDPSRKAGEFDVVGDHVYRSSLNGFNDPLLGYRNYTVTISSTKNPSQAPTVVSTAAAVACPTTEGQPTRFYFGDGGDKQYAEIQWGDGTYSLADMVPSTSPDVFLIEGTHTFNQVGTIPIEVDVCDIVSQPGEPLAGFPDVTYSTNADVTTSPFWPQGNCSRPCKGCRSRGW